MDKTSSVDQVAHSGLSRRAIIRTGANAAWAVPAIAIVTAAPALAASGPAKVTFTGTPNRSGSTLTLTGGLLSNANTLATTALTVAVTVAPTTLTLFGASTGSMVTGFTGPVYSTTAINGGRTLTYTATAQLAGNATEAFAPVISLNSGLGASAAAGTVTVAVTPGGTGTPVSTGAVAFT